MPNPHETDKQEEAKTSLVRMQNFDVSTLPREKELGDRLNFREAVEPAEHLIRLYKQLSTPVLEDLPQQQLNIIRTQANSDYHLFQQIMDFTSEQASPHEVKNAYIQQIEQAYEPAFNKLHPIISYSTSKSADFKRLETEARATIQSVRDQGKELTEQLEFERQQAQQILEDIRNVAAEQGVSQQATYFRDASEEHEEQAEKWRKRTFKLAWLLGGYAVLSLLIHKVPFLAPADVYHSIQLGVSKILIFAVITYMLYLSARNFLAHKHNAIVNKHRQNALMTYTALVDAAQSRENTDVILKHASACIYDPQSTGYSRDSGPSAPSAKSVVELLTKPLSSENE